MRGSNLGIKYDLNWEGAWFESRHEIRLDFWKKHGSNLGTKYDLNLEDAWFESRHKIHVFGMCKFRGSARNATILKFLAV